MIGYWCMVLVVTRGSFQSVHTFVLALCKHYSRRVLCRVQLHSAKKALHSAKPLPSAALSKELSAYLFTAKASLPSAACWALGKGFPECHDGTRQRKAVVMARSRWRPLCRVPRVGTRQRNVFFILFLKKCFADCLHLALGKACFLFFGFSLPSAVGRHSAKLGSLVSQIPSFAECHGHDTRQRSEKIQFFLFLVFHRCKQDIHHIYI